MSGRSKRTNELTSSIVPRGTSFHRSVELELRISGNHWFGDKPLRQIGQAEIDTAAVALYPNCSPATRNGQVYTPISALLKRAGIVMALRRPKGADGNKITNWLWPEEAERLFPEATKLDTEFGAAAHHAVLHRATPIRGVRLVGKRLDEGFAYLPKSKNDPNSPPSMSRSICLRALTASKGIFDAQFRRRFSELINRAAEREGQMPGLKWRDVF
jgi:hypothetical protein